MDAFLDALKELPWETLLAPGGAIVVIISMYLTYYFDRKKQKKLAEEAARQREIELQKMVEDIKDNFNQRVDTIDANLKQAVSDINNKIELNEAKRDTQYVQIADKLDSHNNYAQTFRNVDAKVEKMSDKISSMSEDIAFLKARTK